ncbi:MAG: flagellar filament capping protein FliD [Edaphobacter sp.]
MGTVGLSFGAASSGQGIDVATTVTQIQAASQAIETPWQNQLTALQAQDAVFSTLGTDLATLSTSIEALTDADGVFSNKEGSSSDPNTISLTSSDPTAAAGSHTVVVNSLATTSSEVTGTIADASDTLSGSLTITVNGNSQEIDVNSGNGNDTLSSLASAINSADLGVTAEVLTDSSGSRLSLESNASGAVGQISITSSLIDTTNSNAGVSFSQSQPGVDASLIVDGTAISSSSNTVTNAIPGVTFQLLQADPNSAGVQIEIANDNTDINTAVGNLVSAYNQVVKDISGQVGKDSSGNPEPLSGSPVLAQLQNSLSSALFGGSASGSISNLVQLGITVDASGNGTLDLDTDTLDDALNTNFSDVMGFFQNTGSFGVSILNTVNSLGGDGSPTDLIPLSEAQNASQESSLNSDITNENASLATQKTQLTDELNTANQILQSIPSQLNEVNSIFDSLTGFNPNAQD